MYLTKLLFLAILAMVLAGTVAANEIVVLEENGNTFIALKSENPLKISAFELQLVFSEETTIQSVSKAEAFTLVSNIRNDQGYAKLVGYVDDPTIQYQPAMINRFAKIKVQGQKSFNFTSILIQDFDRNPIPVNNAANLLPTVQPTDVLPSYNAHPRYQSPLERIVESPAPGQAGLPPYTSPGPITTSENSPPLIMQTSLSAPAITGGEKSGGVNESIQRPTGQIPNEQNVSDDVQSQIATTTQASLSPFIVLNSLVFSILIYTAKMRRE